MKNHTIKPRRHGAKPADRWTAEGEFNKALLFDGRAVLVLHEGVQLNAVNMPRLLEALNTAKITLEKVSNGIQDC